MWSARDTVQARRPTRRLALQHAARARSFQTIRPLGTTGSYFTSLGREMPPSPRTSCSQSARAYPTTWWRAPPPKSFKIQLTIPTRPARQAEGRRHLHQIGCLVASRRSMPASTRKWALANRRGAIARKSSRTHRAEPGTRYAKTSIARCAGSTRGDPGHRRGRSRTDIVVGGGHQAYFNTQMRGRPAERHDGP